MKLLTKKLVNQVPPLGSEGDNPDPMVWIKFFYPDFAWTWYATEFDGSDLFYGVVAGDCVELGYFSLKELTQTRGKLGLSIERDRYFTPCRLSTLARTLRAQYGAHCMI